MRRASDSVRMKGCRADVRVVRVSSPPKRASPDKIWGNFPSPRAEADLAEWEGVDGADALLLEYDLSNRLPLIVRE